MTSTAPRELEPGNDDVHYGKVAARSVLGRRNTAACGRYLGEQPNRSMGWSDAWELVTCPDCLETKDA